MHELLTQIARIRGVAGCILVSADGLAMDSVVRDGTDENTLSAAVAGFAGPAQRLAEQFSGGPVRQLAAGGPGGAVLAMPAGPAQLVLLVDAGANLTLLQLEAGPVVERIAQRLAL